jgi:S-formylglutathione hydrolase FrmB
LSLARIQFFARSLEFQTSMTLILPDEGPGPFPVLYLLGGLSDDDTIWTRRTSLERYLAGVPLIVAMPNGSRGWYTNSATPPGRKYQDHILNDVVGTVDRLFPTIRHRHGRAIGGQSMGGYGAFKLALQFPDLFCSAHSHSGVTMGPFWKPELRPDQANRNAAEFAAIFGELREGTVNDPAHLAQICPPEKRPALYFDCGTDDYLYRDNVAFHAHLNAIGYQHEYTQHPGAHSWDYWDKHIQTALAFHRRHLPMPA